MWLSIVEIVPGQVCSTNAGIFPYSLTPVTDGCLDIDYVVFQDMKEFVRVE